MEVQDQGLRLRVLAAVTVMARGAIIVAGQLLSGDLDPGDVLVLGSQKQDDPWKVQRADFFGTGSGEGYFQALREGRRSLWFRPVKDLRRIEVGEIFTLVSKCDAAWQPRHPTARTAGAVVSPRVRLALNHSGSLMDLGEQMLLAGA